MELPSDYAREDTAKRTATAAEAIKDALDLSGAADASAIETAEASQASKDARDAANGDVTGLIEGTSDPAAGHKGVWEQAMAGGFLAPVQFATCQPLHAQVGPYSWTFDHCAVAARVSEIGEYVLWVMLAIGGFVMLTGGRSAGVGV